jgi:hypothetical protein
VEENKPEVKIEPVLQFDPPPWFRREVGFKFVWDFDVCVYLGVGGHRSAETVTLKAGDIDIGRTCALKFHSTKHECFAYRYKNEWHLASIQEQLLNDPTWWSEIRPSE